MKYFSRRECWPSRCQLPSAAWKVGRSLASPRGCMALSEIIMGEVVISFQPIRSQDAQSSRPIGTHQLKINSWTFFTLLDLHLHLQAAPILIVSPNGVNTCSNVMIFFLIKAHIIKGTLVNSHLVSKVSSTRPLSWPRGPWPFPPPSLWLHQLDYQPGHIV